MRENLKSFCEADRKKMAAQYGVRQKVVDNAINGQYAALLRIRKLHAKKLCRWKSAEAVAV